MALKRAGCDVWKLESQASNHTVLKFSPCLNKPLPPLVRIAPLARGQVHYFVVAVAAEAEEILLFIVSVSFQLPQRRGASHPPQAPDGGVRGRRVKAGRGQRCRHTGRLREHVGPDEVRPALATALSAFFVQSRLDDRP